MDCLLFYFIHMIDFTTDKKIRGQILFMYVLIQMSQIIKISAHKSSKFPM